MNVEQIQRIVDKIDKDINELERKIAILEKKEAEKTKKIQALEYSAAKNISQSLRMAKNRQIESHRKEVLRLLSDKSRISQKLAEKRKARISTVEKLHKEEISQEKKISRQQKNLFSEYEQQLAELTRQIKRQETASIEDNYIFKSNGTEEYDIFISYATEDKESFVNSFVQLLQEKFNLKVWYDNISIKWGDNIRTEIDKGVKKSKFGIVILSRSYMTKYWTNYELEALFQRESNGGKLILPIWHNITKQDVQDFSPSLAGKLAMNTAIMTPEEIADRLYELLNYQEK